MATTATFRTKKGGKVWQVNPYCIVDFGDFSTGYELNAESNTAVEGSPLSNQRGLKKKTLSFSSHLVSALGVDVRAEFESWEPLIGQTGRLEIGGKRFGPNWLLTSVKPSDVVIDDSGRFRSMKLTFSFEENGTATTSKETQSSVNSARSASSVTATTEQKSAKKSENKAVKSAPKTAAPSQLFSLGEIVQFEGGPHYTCSNAVYTTAKDQNPGPAKITAIARSAKRPYHVIHTEKTSNVYGWVDASQISSLKGNRYVKQK